MLSLENSVAIFNKPKGIPYEKTTLAHLLPVPYVILPFQSLTLLCNAGATAFLFGGRIFNISSV